MINLRLASAIVLAMLVVTAAVAAPTLGSTTDYATYPVHGTTPAELLADMNRHPIIDPDDGPSYANITHKHDITIGTLATGNQCTVNRLAFTWRFVITTPVAADPLPPRTATLWRNFVKALTAHEEHHRAIFLDCGQDFITAAGKLTGPPSCAGLEAAVRETIDTAYAACMDRQRAFDAGDHARIMSTPFMIEALRGD